MSTVRGLIKRIPFAQPSYRWLRRRVTGDPLPWSDLVGYESLIEVLQQRNLLAIPGDIVEIGTFLGGGARKICRFLTARHSDKTLYIIDIFDSSFDWTRTADGRAMADLYAQKIASYGATSQESLFHTNMEGLKNFRVLREDSAAVVLPCPAVCFAFIDGNHAYDYVWSDFRLIWNKLSPGGIVAFHDYDSDVPDTTRAMNEIIARHSAEFQEQWIDREKHILYVQKKTR